MATHEAEEQCPHSQHSAGTHSEEWYDCEPCAWCGDDTPDPGCECPNCQAWFVADAIFGGSPFAPGITAQDVRAAIRASRAGMVRLNPGAPVPLEFGTATGRIRPVPEDLTVLVETIRPAD